MYIFNLSTDKKKIKMNYSYKAFFILPFHLDFYVLKTQIASNKLSCLVVLEIITESVFPLFLVNQCLLIFFSSFHFSMTTK